jgi:hypothetical protein
MPVAPVVPWRPPYARARGTRLERCSVGALVGALVTHEKVARTNARAAALVLAR